VPIPFDAILAMRRQAQDQQGLPQSLDPREGPIQGEMQNGKPAMRPPSSAVMQPQGPPGPPPGGGAIDRRMLENQTQQMAPGEHPAEQQQDLSMGGMEHLQQNDQMQQAQSQSSIGTPAANIMAKYGVLASMYGLPGQGSSAVAK
jgi:hypothetical protein